MIAIARRVRRTGARVIRLEYWQPQGFRELNLALFATGKRRAMADPFLIDVSAYAAFLPP